MYRTAIAILIVSLIDAYLVSSTHSQEINSTNKTTSSNAVGALIRSLIETVLKEHIEPPTRQQMVLDVIREIEKSKGATASFEWSSMLSDAKSSDQLYNLLATELDRLGVTDELSPAILNSIESAFDKTVTGGFEIVSKSNALATEQIAANRYVGIGVTLSSRVKFKGQQFMGVFENGPAAEAGILVQDYLQAVDGTSTIDRSLEEVIPCLRGPAGTTVMLTVRTELQPTRELKLVRRVIPFKSVELIESDVDKGALFIRIDRIAASSLNEIQTLIAKFQVTGELLKIVVFDLRRATVDNLHYLHLFADGILDHAEIGRVQSRSGVRTLKTEDGTIVGQTKVAILYTPGNSNALDMLAPACSDAGVQVYFTPQQADTTKLGLIDYPGAIGETIPVPGTDHFVRMTIHRLLDNLGAVVTFEPSDRSHSNLKDLSILKKVDDTEFGYILRDLDL